MKSTTVLIVGAGPAGAACARELQKLGIDFIIVDKSPFPRDKTCAGWVSPEVFKLLGTKAESYPHSLLQFDRINFHLPLGNMPVKTRQYSIKRCEFDAWLLESASIRPQHGLVRQIQKELTGFVVNNQWKSHFLVGAGGTHCPVRYFLYPTKKAAPSLDLIIGLAAEIHATSIEKDCHLWFFENGISGYSWYLPKADGSVNVGIGARFALLKKKGETINHHWKLFTDKLIQKEWLTPPLPHPKGHFYYLQGGETYSGENGVYLIGDAARLSTLDMGEGIYNAVKSGIMAAQAIAERIQQQERMLLCYRMVYKKAVAEKPLLRYKGKIRRYSFPGILFSKFSQASK